ncbi:hypothetical protein F5Y04DRAFT_281707 [Hypomontagnella monticulosa]|nr:hypothetical protein F5Y04DRAFT_281707 [Hypomontagnella monticulosa]
MDNHVDAGYAGDDESERESKKPQTPDPDDADHKETKSHDVVTMDNWYELLDKPETTAIIRSEDNWLRRLAAASLSSQLGYQTAIFPNQNCKEGCLSNAEFINRHYSGYTIIW